MVQKVHLSAQERDVVQALIRSGLRARVDQWTVARIALARSLQEPEAPRRDAFTANPQREGGIELHAPQLLGEGKGPTEDYADAFRAVLSMYQGENLFDDEDTFHDALQRHIRRGLSLLRAEWAEGQDFPQYLLEQLYFDRRGSQEAGQTGAELLGEKLERALAQLGIGATILAAQDGPRLTRFTLELGELDDLDRLRRGLGKLAFALGFGQESLATALAPGERRVGTKCRARDRKASWLGVSTGPDFSPRWARMAGQHR